MDFQKWSESEVEYGRKILMSGLQGARSGEQEFLHGRPLAPYFRKSIRKAWTPAMAGACLGMLSGSVKKHEESLARTLLFGLLGGAIGFAVGVIWESRELTESAANGALRNIHRVRDEHWVEKHPVAYA